MGIKHLKTILETFCQESGIHHFPSVKDFITAEKNRFYRENDTHKNICNPIKKLQIKKLINDRPYFVGIDAYLYAIRYKRVFKKIEYGFLRQILLSLSAKIIPIYVFDGSTPEQKKKTVFNRQLKKQKIYQKLQEMLLRNTTIPLKENLDLSTQELLEKLEAIDDGINLLINKNENSSHLLYSSNYPEEYREIIKLKQKTQTIDHNDIHNLKCFLDMLGIPHITADGEADDMLASMYKKNIIQACQSDDMDMLPKGCGNVIQITNKGITQYVLKEILEKLVLNYNQFIDLCILLGSDYYTTYLPKIRAIELYNTFRSHDDPCLENFVKVYSQTDINIQTHLESYQKIRDLFLNTEKINSKLNGEYNFDKVKIAQKLKPIKLDTIVQYFKNVGIYFDNNHLQKINQMLTNSNNFILSLQSNPPKYV